jgi:multimeric flavodoxin WrbA
LLKIAVIHASSPNGSLARLAQAFATGARSVPATGTMVMVIEKLTEASWTAAASMDAIVFGAVAHRSGATVDFGKFAAQSIRKAVERSWRQKLCGGFTNSGAGDEERAATLRHLEALAVQHSMSWLPVSPLAFVGPLERPSVSDRLDAWRAALVSSSTPVATSNGELIAVEAYGKQFARTLHAPLGMSAE